MRFDLRLRGRTADGRECRAVVSVNATSLDDLQRQADMAARFATWETAEPPHDPIPKGSHITIEHVERV